MWARDRLGEAINLLPKLDTRHDEALFTLADSNTEANIGQPRHSSTDRWEGKTGLDKG